MLCRWGIMTRPQVGDFQVAIRGIFVGGDVLLTSGRSPHTRSLEKPPSPKCMFQPVIIEKSEKVHHFLSAVCIQARSTIDHFHYPFFLSPVNIGNFDIHEIGIENMWL